MHCACEWRGHRRLVSEAVRKPVSAVWLRVLLEAVHSAPRKSVPVAARAATLPLTLTYEGVARGSTWQARFSRLGLVCQPEAGQRHAGEANAEFLQCCAARDGLRHTFREFIEFVAHNSAFVD